MRAPVASSRGSTGHHQATRESLIDEKVDFLLACILSCLIEISVLYIIVTQICLLCKRWLDAARRYPQDEPKWKEMSPLMKAWGKAIQEGDTPRAQQIIEQISPILESTNWFSNYRGKVTTFHAMIV